MSGTRNLRFIIPVVGIILIIGVFFTSKSSFGNSVQVIKTPSNGDSVITDGGGLGLTEEKSKPPKKPYKIETGKDRGGKDGQKDKVIAEKLGDGNKDSSKQDPSKLDSSDIGADGIPSFKEVSGNENCKETAYVVMIDAGSTGSRVHVYEFDVCVTPPRLLNEKFDMLKPGLSHFDTDTSGAAHSLDPLLKVAMDTVPKEKRGCTPVSVKATAGLRLLGEEKAENILQAVRKHLENDYPFAIVPGDGISLMDGKDEGVYAWITTNYLLGNIGGPKVESTAAVFDLGGGSTQIIFEPEFGTNERMVDGEHKYELDFGGRKFTLYQFSHLGYGLMQGRNKVNSLIVESNLKKESGLAKSKFTKEKDMEDAKASVTLLNPCIPPGTVASNVPVKLADDEYYLVNMKGSDVASGAQCRFLAEKVLNKDAECSSRPCSFNGVHQPSLTRTFKQSSDMYVFSYFYDRTNPLGFPSSFTVEELGQLAKIVCGGGETWKDALLDEHIKELNEEPQWCLDLTFITALLHTGYDIPLYRELRTARTIDNNELGWCLGASLPLLDKTQSGWECKVSKVE